MTGSRKTLQHYNDAGHAHALTFSCFQGQAFLSKDRSRQWLVEALRNGLEKHAYDLWAWVIMPEHVHLLVWPRNVEYSISAFLQSVKTSVTRKAVAFVKHEAPAFLSKMQDLQPNGSYSFRFWQRGGGYDRNFIEPKTVWHQIDYLHANPVRRGLCEYAEDWYWSSATNYADVRTGPLEIAFPSLPRTAEG